jgi:hypothetical protein
LEELIHYQIETRDGRWRLQFDFDTLPGSDSLFTASAALCCSPIEWIGAPSK